MCQDVWSGRASQDDVGRLTNVRAASMYSASWWSLSSGPSWVSARIQDSLAARPQWAILAPSLVVAPGRPFVHLLHPLADLGGKLPVIGKLSSFGPQG